MLHNENTRSKKAIHPPLLHPVTCRESQLHRLYFSLLDWFFFFLISQYSNQTHTRNNKGICLAILVPPRHQSHYIKKSKLLFITAFQNSSIIQSTQRTFTQWKGFLLSGYTYHLDAKRASFSNIFHGLHELSELFIGKEKQGLYVLPALWRVWKHYTMERKAKEVKLG